MDAAFANCTARQKQILFLALTFMVILVIALLCPDVATALIIVGALLAFCAAYAAAGRQDERRDGPAAKAQDAKRDGFFPVPGAPAPYAVAAPAPRRAGAAPYPGAIDADEYESELGFGLRDRTEGDNDWMPEGNPYNRGRIGYAAAAGPCDDDEANDAAMDGDELMAIQGYSRNDAQRVTAGTMNRRRDMDKYLEEELAEEESSRWWGRHEE